MTDEKLTKLANIQDCLLDCVIDEADPSQWPGAGLGIGKMTQEERGDRYWCKKNAAATLTLIAKIHNIRNTILSARPKGDAENDDDGLDETIKTLEKRAQAKLLEFQQRYVDQK